MHAGIIFTVILSNLYGIVILTNGDENVTGIDSVITRWRTHPEIFHPMMSGLVQDFPRYNCRTFSVNSSDDGKSHIQRRSILDFPVVYNTGTCKDINKAAYRSIDGSCNHKNNLGQADLPLGRLLPPDYEDGTSAPRTKGIHWDPLPSARTVSQTVLPDKRATSSLTIFTMQWGQFIDHEKVSTPLVADDLRGKLNCCGPDKTLPVNSNNSECFPIIFPSPDPDFEGSCMEFLRSEPVRDKRNRIILPRENTNVVTSFIDASTVYGTSEEKLELLRNPMKRYMLDTSSGNFLPSNNKSDCIKQNNETDICFFAGDDRVNEQPGLTLMHTIFLRYHNYLAEQIKQDTPSDSDEAIFQKARAIIMALMQKIVYQDWLPIIISSEIREEFRLDLNESERTAYNSSIDPRIFQADSTAVFRFGHSLIPRSLPINSTYRPLLRTLFFSPYVLRQNIDTITEGFCNAVDEEDRSQPVDRHIVEEVTGHLFESELGEKRGFDLAALNIQRGRDHGLPSFNSYRVAVGLPKIKSFRDPALGDGGPSLEKVYNDVDDMELFPAGMSEPASGNGLVGPTFGRLMAIQFQRLKFGDRYFFNNDVTTNKLYFSDDDVKKIMKISLAHVLCLTTNISEVQRNVFKIKGKGNRAVKCKKLIKEHPATSKLLQEKHRSPPIINL